MNLEPGARPKKAGRHDVIMEHFARTSNSHARRQDFGIQFRQQIHTIGDSIDKFHLSKFQQYKMLWRKVMRPDSTAFLFAVATAEARLWSQASQCDIGDR